MGVTQTVGWLGLFPSSILASYDRSGTTPRLTLAAKEEQRKKKADTTV
jgi:hypothetical protein